MKLTLFKFNICIRMMNILFFHGKLGCDNCYIRLGCIRHLLLTAYAISTKVHSNVPFIFLFQSCSNCSTPPNNMDTKVKSETSTICFKHIYITAVQSAIKLHRIVSWLVSYQNYPNHFVQSHNMATRAKMDYSLNNISSY